MESYKKSKITLSILRGKAINSSVPTFRFNATAEELEELYTSEDDLDDQLNDIPAKAASDAESSPNKLVPNKLSKRSTSVDVCTSDLSPPSDPWRFFTDIKGKITKSVEGKISEYKIRAAEAPAFDASPKKVAPIRESRECKEGSVRIDRDSKEGSRERESSSLSDSDELSESSLSRTCGIVSTTEGVEMSSEEEGNASFSEAKYFDREEMSKKSSIKQGSKKKLNVTIITKEGKEEVREASSAFLLDLQQLQDADHSTDIEAGIDVLTQISNIHVTNDAISISQVLGEDIRNDFLRNDESETTTFAPAGFVDLRLPCAEYALWDMVGDNKCVCILLVAFVLYCILPLSSYMSGFVAGNLIMLTVLSVYTSLKGLGADETARETLTHYVNVPAAREERPVLKYQGWVNEYPDVYDPCTYHISQTQSVYLRLQANLLKISNTKQKIPKRASYNEPEHKLVFTKHRIYNLIGAEVLLLPQGLTKIRHWSKKYPICIILSKDQLCYDTLEKATATTAASARDSNISQSSSIESTGMQVYSKLIDDVCAQTESAAADREEEAGNVDDKDEEDNISFFEISETIDPVMDMSVLHHTLDSTYIYIFARTDREKEHWYRQFKRATHRLGHGNGIQDSSSDIVKEENALFAQYVSSMSQVITPIESGGTHSVFMHMCATGSRASDTSLRSRRSRQSLSPEAIADADLQWLSAFINRMTHDMHRSAEIIRLIHDRVAKKLNAIKLPMFIESLRMTELTISNHAPKILKIGKPHVDEWGLWVDVDVSYEGSVVVMVLTKLNLLKLKQQGERSGEALAAAKSAIYHSDVEDTAESSSEDDGRRASGAQGPLDDAGHPVPGLGGVSKQNKKLLHMVDRIAESRLFQRATENKYIKKAIEGVSNTDVGLKLEVKACRGCLVMNIPPPPSDRIWFGFRPVPLPKLHLTAQPVVGERNWNFIKVSNWIEKRVYKEFLKVLLLPNMEDILVPGMDPHLPE